MTAYLPTLITAPEERLVAALGEIGERRARPADARSPRRGPVHLASRGSARIRRRRGATPTRPLLERLLAAGPVRLFTLAPELPGALELVDLLVARGITVSAGHTDATADEANAAFDRGVADGHPPLQRDAPVQPSRPRRRRCGACRPDVVVQIILDFVHLAPDTVRLVWRAAGGRLALVTDAVAGAGVSGDGSYRLGDIAVEVRDGVVRRDDGVLAGSVLTMIDAVRNLHALGVPLEARSTRRRPCPRG